MDLGMAEREMSRGRTEHMTLQKLEGTLQRKLSQHRRSCRRVRSRIVLRVRPITTHEGVKVSDGDDKLGGLRS
jgi:hypothetical protein